MSDINGRWSVATFALLSPIAAAVLLVMPLFVSAAIDTHSISAAEGGFLASAELAGMGLAALPALYWVNRINWQKITYSALLGICCLNIISVFVDLYAALMALRLLCGVFGGTLMTVLMMSIARTSQPDRNFGLWLMAQYAFAAIVFLLFSSLVARFGVDTIFIIIAVLALGGTLLVHFIPAKTGHEAEDKNSSGEAGFPRLFIVIGFLSICVFNAGISAVWAFAQQVGAIAEIEPALIGTALAFSSLAAILGASAAATLGVRFGRMQAILFGIVMLCLGILILNTYPGFALFVLGNAMFVFAWNFTLPYYLGTVALIDQSGVIMILSNAAIGLGISVGPLMVGPFLVQDSYDASHWGGGILLLVSLMLIISLSRRLSD